MPALAESHLSGIPVRRGKVRDVYDFDEKLLLVASDRISAFDFVLPTAIPDKGRVLTKISEFWFAKFDVPHHLISMDATTLPLPDGADVEALDGRSMVVRKSNVVPVECVVRGYLSGSGWKEYQQSGTVCGVSSANRVDRERPASRADLHAHDQGGRRPRHADDVRGSRVSDRGRAGR